MINYTEKLMESIPGLREIYNSPTLAEYFRAKTLHLSADLFPEKELMIECIAAQAQRLYGVDVRAELRRRPIIETGTHMCFIWNGDEINVNDLAKTDGIRGLLNQNILISAALLRNIGADYHIGGYGTSSSSDISSGGLYPLGGRMFPINTYGTIKSGCLYGSAGIGKEYFNESVLLVAKLSNLKNITTVPALRNKIETVLAPLNSSPTNYSVVQKAYDRLNNDNRSVIESCLDGSMDEEYASYEGIFSSSNNLSDQVALAQSMRINRVLKGTGIRHCSVDIVSATSRFLCEQLKSKSGFWYDVFSDADKSEKLYNAFAGVRSAWGVGESPFMHVKKGVLNRMDKIPLEKLAHNPETLASMLEKGIIVPGTCMLMLATLSAGFLAVGGWFQSNYAVDMNARFQEYLKEIGRGDMVETVRKISSNTVLLSLIAVPDKGLIDIAKMPSEERMKMISDIPSLSGKTAVDNGAPLTVKRIMETSQGYIR